MKRQKSIIEEVEKTRRAVCELILTALILGLTLNLFANLLWESSDNLVWRAVLIICSLIGTCIVIQKVVELNYEGIRNQTRDFHIKLLWNSKTGEFPKDVYVAHYSPQNLLHYGVENLDQQDREQLYKVLPRVGQPFPMNGKYLSYIFMSLILETLRLFPNVPGMISDAAYLSSIEGDSHEQLVFKRPIDEPIVILPGLFELEYKMIDEVNSILKIKWIKRYNGEMCISFQGRAESAISPVFGHDSVQVSRILGIPSQKTMDLRDYKRFEYSMRITIDFSAWNLFRGRKHSRELLDWTSKLFTHLENTINWENLFNRARESLEN
jgi:hypothetical protein